MSSEKKTPERVHGSGIERKPNEEWFKTKFEERGLSLRAAARAIEVDSAILAHVLYGNRRFQIEMAINLALLLEVRLEEVLLHAGYPEVKKLKKR